MLQVAVTMSLSPTRLMSHVSHPMSHVLSFFLPSVFCFLSYDLRLTTSLPFSARKASPFSPYAILTITTNRTGTTKIAIEEAATIPPITVNPMVRRAIAPAPDAIANGVTPKINASEVIRIGRKRS